MKTVAITLCVMLAGAAGLAAPSTNKVDSPLSKKLDSIIIPSVELSQSNLNDVVPFLAGESKKHDRSKRGVEIILMDRENQSDINLNLKNASLLTILKSVAEQAGLSLDLKGKSVILKRKAASAPPPAAPGGAAPPEEQQAGAQ